MFYPKEKFMGQLPQTIFHMRKNIKVKSGIIFIAISILFVSLTDSKFLFALLFLLAAIPLEGKIHSKLVQKLIESAPLVYFIVALLTGMDLFYILTTLLIVVMLAKFVLPKTKRDYFEIFIVGILLILLTSVSTISLSFTILLYLFLVSGASMLIFSQLNKTNIRISKKFWASLFTLSAVSMLFAFLLFFSFPRLSLGYLHGINLRTNAQSGFSKQVVIEKGSVTLNNQIVMRVVTKELNSPLYISGMHYSFFDGKKWKAEDGKRKIFPVGVTNNFGITSGMVKTTIYLEPIGTDILLGPDKLVGIRGEFLYLRTNVFGDFFTDLPYYKTIKYDAFSSIKGKSPIVTIDRVKDPSRYLQTPNFSAKFIKIAKQAAKGLNEQEKIESIVNFLKRNYTYSLNPTAQNIEDFIANKKSGYCEHFATAFVMIARINNIPARLVSGFVTSEFNPDGNYFIVRAKDAHAWAEVYLPNEGWIRVDPTPTAKTPKPSAIALFIDSIRMARYRNIVTYNSTKQMELLSSIQRSVSKTSVAINSWMHLFRKIVKKWKPISLLTAIVLLLLILLRNKYLPKNKLYSQIVYLIGKDKEPYETLIEYANRKNKLNQMYPLIIAYYKLRFSQNQKNEKEIKVLLKSIKMHSK
jgi:hypothetical protein